MNLIPKIRAWCDRAEQRKIARARQRDFYRRLGRILDDLGTGFRSGDKGDIYLALDMLFELANVARDNGGRYFAGEPQHPNSSYPYRPLGADLPRKRPAAPPFPETTR